MRILFSLLTLIAISFSGYTSNKSIKPNNHHHSDWELGVAFGAVYLLNEDEVAPGVHLHLLRRIDRFERFSLGLGFETVIDEHKHFNSALVFKYDIWKGLNAIVSPGILFLKSNNVWERKFSVHYELLYEFKIKGLHLGPVFEYSYSRNDQHLMLGLHLGFSF